MKGFTFLSLVLVLMGLGSRGYSLALLDPSLQGFANSESQGKARVLVLVKPQGASDRPERYDRPRVISYFKEAARRAIMPVLASWQNNELPGVEILNAYWINGAILADVTPQGIQSLRNHDAVTKIYMNKRLLLDPGLRIEHDHGALDATPGYAFPAIGLDKLIQEKPQINGDGVIVGVVDTGVDGTHPALQGKIPLFYNGQTKAVSEPVDFDQHGTHVSGTIAGGDRQNNMIGVAPGAKIVMAGVVEQGFDAMLEGMQWFLDAEKNPLVANKIRAIGCSWNTGGAPDQEVFYRALAVWEAAGILPVFSAGNAGPSAGSITNPHEYPGTFAVAAYGADGKVADFSSRGPGHFKDQDTKKPDLAAPGVDITSSIPGGNYEAMSGTSMAQPHVTGTTALLLQLKPDLNPAQIRDVLMKSATPGDDTPAGQWSADYGYGKLNAYNAIKLLSSLTTDEDQSDLLSQFTGSMIMTGPSQINAKEFSKLSLGEVDGPQDQYPQGDTSGWITN
jgi:subtilisin family serine protease